MREALKGWGRRLARPQRQASALTADVLAVIRLTAPKPRARGRGRGIETPAQAAQRARFDLALVAALSDAGLRRSEAASLTWGDVVRWDDGSGRITVIRSKTDVEAAGAVVAITSAAMEALDAIRPVGVGGEVKVFGLSESPIARRVKVIAKAAGLTDWEFFSGHSGRVGMARRMAQNGAPTHEIERQGRWKQGGGRSVATPAASPPGQLCDTCRWSCVSVEARPAATTDGGISWTVCILIGTRRLTLRPLRILKNLFAAHERVPIFWRIDIGALYDVQELFDQFSERAGY